MANEITEDESLSCGNPKAAERDAPTCGVPARGMSERGALRLEEADGLEVFAVDWAFAVSVFFENISELLLCRFILSIILYAEHIQQSYL